MKRLLLFCVTVLLLASQHHGFGQNFLSAEFSEERQQLAVKRFAQSLTYRTISQTGADADYSEFFRYHAFLQKSFSLTHQNLSVTTIGRASLLYTWQGSDPGLSPVILCAHMDVVPADDSAWSHPPFAGTISEDCIWGRGARDFKPGLLSILEATELLVAQGFRPARTIYLAFGHDEEVQGYNGAGEIAAYLAGHNIKAHFVLDEGGGIAQGMFPGIDAQLPVAIINTAEKGYLSLNLEANLSGGHSATPGPVSAILVLNEALARINDNPFSAELQSPASDMFQALSSAMSFPYSTLFGNLWLTGGIIKKILAGNPDSAAMIRTTTAVTAINAGEADNIIPARATATINMRLLPGMTADKAVQHITAVINDPRITISIRGRYSEAPAISGTDTQGFRCIKESIQSTFGNIPVIPGIVTGTTDIRHYARLSDNLYRFAPSVSTRTFSGNAHKADERLPVENYLQYCRFYINLMQRAAQ